MITPENKKSLKISLKKIRGLCDKLEQMVEGDSYCLDIAQQANAGIGLFRGFNQNILKNHLQTCGHKKMQSKDEADRLKFIEELITVFNRSSSK
ncbi:MAG TPA: metal-sensing transcriptional repressor [Candidatus Gracilibacteria bacterium]